MSSQPRYTPTEARHFTITNGMRGQTRPEALAYACHAYGQTVYDISYRQLLDRRRPST